MSLLVSLGPTSQRGGLWLSKRVVAGKGAPQIPPLRFHREWLLDRGVFLRSGWATGLLAKGVPQGLKPSALLSVTARLKSCPDTKHQSGDSAKTRDSSMLKPCPFLQDPCYGEGARVAGATLEGGEAGVADGVSAAGGAGAVARTSKAWRGKLKLPPVSSMTLTWQM
jgi:hypothetical protein